MSNNANDIQHGGDHYKKQPIQVWDFIALNNIGYLEGNAIKYLSRWKDKGGIEDLKKARHYIDKLIETESIKQDSKDMQNKDAYQSLPKYFDNKTENEQELLG